MKLENEHELRHAENLVKAFKKAIFNDMQGMEILAFISALAMLERAIHLFKNPQPELPPPSPDHGKNVLPMKKKGQKRK